MRKIYFFALALLLGLVASCIAVPYDYGDEEVFQEADLSFIVPGQTTREELETGMANVRVSDDEKRRSKFKLYTLENDSFWLYVHERGETKWDYIALDPHGGGDAGTVGGIDYRFLFIEFDDEAVVSSLEFSKSEGNRCNRQGICTAGGYYELLASEADDTNIKLSNQREDRCGLFIYGTPWHGLPSFSHILIQIDGDSVGQLIDKKQYFFVDLAPGIHELAPFDPEAKGEDPLVFSCEASDQLYFEYEMKRGAFFNRLDVYVPKRVSESSGRKAVKNRHLTKAERLSLEFSQ